MTTHVVANSDSAACDDASAGKGMSLAQARELMKRLNRVLRGLSRRYHIYIVTITAEQVSE